MCCSGCDQPPSVHDNSVTVNFKGDYNTEPGKLAFKIIIITGSDSCKFVFFIFDSFHLYKSTQS